MFRLKKLEINGFKSFVDRTSLTLPSRMTAIVGPNGSGKSNICDAVMWVLGEQSARVLRGTTMEDVIFNGSARRRPLGLAEVSLTLESRAENQWTETGGEVVITRRVARDGEGEYLLNGKRSRLKDIQDLLLGTGLGVRAYSIIEQQKIDLILSTKPQDRRRLIEEAAGVSKYKIRKRQAEVKLEETRANLLRLSDIVSEIERTCASLKRQAGRAARWKEQADALADLKRKLFRVRGERLATAVAEAERVLAEATVAEGTALAEAGRTDAAFEESRRLADEAERERRESARAFAEAREALLAAEAAAAAAAREAEETEARRELLLAQRQDVEAEHLRSGDEAARGELLLEEVSAALESAEERARTTSEALAAATRAESEAATRREASRRDLLAATGRAADAGNREREAANMVDRLGFALSRHQERKARGQETLEERRRAEAAAAEAETTAQAALEEARERLETTGSGRREAESRLGALSREKDEAQKGFHALDRRMATLEAVLAARESGGEGARKALDAAGVGAAGVLADYFEAKEGFEKALDAALGPALEAPVVRGRDELDRVLSAVRSAHLGTARFVHPIPETPFPLKPLDERVLGVTRELLTPRPGEEAMAASLPDAVVVETVEDALALAHLLPERTIASRDGVVVRGATVEAAGTEVPLEGLFTVRRDLRERAHEREALAARLASLDAEIAATREATRELAAALDREQAAVRKAERDHSESRARLASAGSERSRAEKELAALDDEERALSADLLRMGEERSAALELSVKRTAEMAELERSIEGLESAVETARERRLESASDDAQARTARDVLRERQRAARQSLEGHRARATQAARRLAEIDDAVVALEGRKESALATGAEARERCFALASEVGAADQRQKESDRQAEGKRELLEELDRAVHAAREALDAGRRARFDAELALERKRSDHAHLAEGCQAAFGCAPGELPPVDEELGDDALASLGDEVQQRTQALERLGPVNHAALEEFEVESSRLREMSTQKLDLEKSLEQILETIRTINATSSERFQEAFTAINAGFDLVFQRLFRGGTASMQLLDENDLLDSGIEIMAQPPGKRNQTIGLLSGGEKALTAVALLVSIFKYKPSPFCILDEVDAPLDEANIDRFTSLLQELSEETQFVLITHSKRTMEAAQALYGVTQEEPGVSKIVSVRFD